MAPDRKIETGISKAETQAAYPTVVLKDKHLTFAALKLQECGMSGEEIDQALNRVKFMPSEVQGYLTSMAESITPLLVASVWEFLTGEKSDILEEPHNYNSVPFKSEPLKENNFVLPGREYRLTRECGFVEKSASLATRYVIQKVGEEETLTWFVTSRKNVSQDEAQKNFIQVEPCPVIQIMGAQRPDLAQRNEKRNFVLYPTPADSRNPLTWPVDSPDR